MELPDKKIKANIKSPEMLVLFSLPKVGKTTALSELKDSIILDFEGGTNYVDAVKVTINTLNELNDFGKSLAEANKALGEGKYKYKIGIFDTVTALEKIAKERALQLYKLTPMGKNFKGSDVLTLPNGAGYYWMRRGFDDIVTRLKGLFKYIILSGHVKDKYITKDDKEVEVMALDLTGKLSGIVTGKSDAIGYLYRRKNQCILNFKSNNAIAGARPPHLANKEVLLSEVTPEGEFKTYWENIYLD